MNASTAITDAFLLALNPSGTIGLGYDVATTRKKKSNWSSLTAMQHQSPVYVSALTARWKSSDPDVAIELIRAVFDMLAGVSLRPRRLCIDASNERYHAQTVKKAFRGDMPVQLIAGNDKVKHGGLEYQAKELLGSLYVAACEDNFVYLARETWIRNDHRLVKRNGNKFDAETGKDGGHGDTFDSGKLAYWAINGGSARVTAHAVPVGGVDTGQQSQGVGGVGRKLKNQFRGMFRKGGGGPNF